MRTTFEIFRFELLEQARRGANYIFFAIFFAVALGITALFGSSLQSLFGYEVPIYANAPSVVAIIMVALMLFGLLGLSGGLFGQAASKDFELNFYGLLVTSGVSEWHYILGRLAASWLTAMVVFIGVPLGLLAGLLLPSNQPIYIGPLSAGSYLYGYFVHIVPSVIIYGAMFFAVGLLTRRSIWVYLSGLVLPTLVNALLSPLGWLGLENLEKVLDPFCTLGLDQAASWTPMERNTLAVPIPPGMIANRLLWLALTAAGLYLLARYFKFSQPPLELENLPLVRRFTAAWQQRRAAATAAQDRLSEPAAPSMLATRNLAAIPQVTVQFTLKTALLQLWERLRFEAAQVAGNKWFWIALLVGTFVSILTGSRGMDSAYGVSSYPTTDRLLSNTSTFTWLVALLLIFFLGESIWRERDTQIDGLLDTTPTPNWVFFLGKLLAVIAIQVMALAIFMLSAMAVQTLQGYFNYEPGLYFTQLFTLQLVYLVLMTVPALFFHVIVNNKYVGHFLSLGFFLAVPLLRSLSLPNVSKLVMYAYTPDPVYSDMNGYGHFMGAVRWFQLYWLLLAALLLFLAQLLWPRGIETGLRQRWQVARARLVGPTLYGLVGTAALFVAVGGWIMYNTTVLYRTAEQLQAEEFRAQAAPEAQQAAIRQYLERYAPLAQAQPVLANVAADVNIYPHERRMAATVRYTLENRTTQPVTELLLTDRATPALTDLKINGAPVQTEMTPVVMYRVHHMFLPQPIPPGGTVELSFSYQRRPSPGFASKPDDYDLVENGSRLISDSFLPEIGYMDYLKEALDEPAKQDQEEEKPPEGDQPHNDAGEVDYLAKTADLEAARQRGATGLGGRAVSFQGTICTDPDQTAFLLGSQVRAWTENGRRCFEYQSDAPVMLQFFIVSGRYQLQEEDHHGVRLQVYYHPSHAYNIASLMDAMKASLDNYSAEYGPYLQRHLRIVEIPAYTSAAISTPGTIVFGEPMGMYSRIQRDQKGVVDYPFFVTAHETAHQWWGGQLIPARAEGLYVILETLTQYSAVKTVDKFYGPESVRSFLKFELDKYLQARLGGRDVPLAQAADQKDSHVYYNKGAVVMYTLRDYLGANYLDGTLKQFMDDFRNGPPFPLSLDLMNYLKNAAPPGQQRVITDLLETITLWDLATEKAEVTQRPDGRYELTLVVRARKVRSDNLGNETPVEMQAEPMDIGALDTAGNFIYLQKHPLNSGENTFTITLDQAPAQAGIDPVHKLIARSTTNNVIVVTTR